MSTTTTTTTTTTSPSHPRYRTHPHSKSTPLTSTVHRPTTESRLGPFLTHSVPPKRPLRVKIDDKWFDLSQWQLSHPGGYEVLQFMDGLDATEAFHSLHSEEAKGKMKKMFSTPAKAGDTPPPSTATMAFRHLRQQLVSEGWFNNHYGWEAFYFVSVFGLSFIGTILSYYYQHTLLPILCIGIAMQQAGWIGHDHTHQRGFFSVVLCFLHSGLINAFSRSWWSNKHNTHHVYTNHLGVDMDIENDPVIHLFFPEKGKDLWQRKYQHLYFYFAYSFLYVSWRIQSLQFAIHNRIYKELFPMAINYIWLYSLPLTVSIPAVLLGGFLVAIIVTVTHQSEEMFGPEELKNYSFVEGQFLTTRDAYTENPIMNWLWGGMQYQLEHHLFPTMPKYYYRSLVPRVKQFAKENNLEYRVDTMMDIWRRNTETIKFYAGERPKEI